MTGPDRNDLAALAVDLAAKSGIETTREMLAAEAGIPLARVNALFPRQDDLFDAALERWFAPLIAIMDEVMGSDLPAHRKLYEFIGRRFTFLSQEYRRDPEAFTILQQVGNSRFDRIETYIDLADHYLCEIIAEAQAEGAFAGLSIERTLSLVNQMVFPYVNPEVMASLGDKLTLDRLATIVDTLFAGLSAENGGAGGTARLRIA